MEQEGYQERLKRWVELMAKLIISGDNDYVSKLKKHLAKEHPSTRNKMKLKMDLKRSSFGANLKKTLQSAGNVAGKVLHDAVKPLEKMDQDLKKLGVE